MQVALLAAVQDIDASSLRRLVTTNRVTNPERHLLEAADSRHAAAPREAWNRPTLLGSAVPSPSPTVRLVIRHRV